MVRYADGSVLAQLGTPDMRTPIAHAMAVSAARELRRGSAGPFCRIGSLTFAEPERTIILACTWRSGVRDRSGGDHRAERGQRNRRGGHFAAADPLYRHCRGPTARVVERLALQEPTCIDAVVLRH